MLLRRETPLSSGGDDDIAPKAMPLLCWEAHRTTAHLHHQKWNTTAYVLLCLLSPYFFCNTPAPLAPLQTPLALVVQGRAALTAGGGINLSGVGFFKMFSSRSSVVESGPSFCSDYGCPTSHLMPGGTY